MLLKARRRRQHVINRRWSCLSVRTKPYQIYFSHAGRVYGNNPKRYYWMCLCARYSKSFCNGFYQRHIPTVVFTIDYGCDTDITDYERVCISEEEREQVERLRWPSRGYLQELSEYQQRRRKLRKSRCIVMWPQPGCQNPVENRGRGEQRREKIMTKSETGHRQRNRQNRFFSLSCWMKGCFWRT